MNALHVVSDDLNYICHAIADELLRLEGKVLLITGGGGFLGYYLIKTIVHWNACYTKTAPIKVVVFDNFVREVQPWLLDLKSKNSISVFERDIAEYVIQPTQVFHYIMHAASIASPTFYRLHPLKTMDANVNGLRRILEYAVLRQNTSQPVEGILLFSSSEIYGDPTLENIPTPESYFGNVSCTGPRACYDESKRYAETLSVTFHQQHAINIKIARPFNNYGPGLQLSDKRLMPDIASNILNNKDVELYSDGSPTRTFCYVADAVVGYFKILINGTAGESYNVGTMEPEISVQELAMLMVKQAKSLYNYQGKIRMAQNNDAFYIKHNPQRRCPCIDKIALELHFHTTITLEEGIRKSLIWYRDNQYATER